MKLAKLLGLGIALVPFYHQPVEAFSVCGLSPEEASFKTENRLVTICLGEASLQMVITFHDGTGYQIIPVQREGNLFRGTDGAQNFIIDENTFVIGTDGEPPIRERVTEHR
ncbi:hypothetical protein [Gloeocapsa sp. PCC 73106]|uniref:hypothetical protein n=1 Tax=Gloeocapsa sp. PCC 73106 TaxID=102232 RepID=UPI0002F71305|nr:hypothetical protein [Gloeocapsa sp. PCC 73106]